MEGLPYCSGKRESTESGRKTEISICRHAARAGWGMDAAGANWVGSGGGENRRECKGEGAGRVERGEKKCRGTRNHRARPGFGHRRRACRTKPIPSPASVFHVGGYSPLYAYRSRHGKDAVGYFVSFKKKKKKKKKKKSSSKRPPLPSS